MTSPIVIPCATEADWHRERTKGIGASEAAALVGLNPYMTPRQLWSKKKLAEPDTPKEAEWLEAGHFAELMVAPWYEKRTGRRVLTPQEFYSCPGAYAVIVRHPTLPIFATPDRILEDVRGPLQIKNVSAYILDQWEEGDATVPPLHVQIQVQLEMLCMGASDGAIAAVIGGNKLRHAPVSLNETFARKIGLMASRFVDSLAGDVSPAAAAGDLEDIKRAFPGSVEGLSKELENPGRLLDYARICAQIAQLEKVRDDLKAQLQLELGSAESGTIQGQKAVTFKSSERHEQAREARVISLRVFRLDNSIAKAAKAALPPHATSYPALPG